MRRPPRARKRVANYQVIFVETEQELVVTRSAADASRHIGSRCDPIGPRGNVYD
ncbi:MAG TPA: hypothetical protein VGG99_02505 [Acetobacteraceae bacterium]|jgi:hypothetical protein